MSGESSPQPNRVIGLVTYLGFFITGIIFLYLEPYNRDEYVRFHARQSIGYSVFWFAVEIVFSVFIAVLPHPLGVLLSVILDIINIVLAIFWVYLMYKAYVGERYRIPELADIIEGVFNQAASP